LENSFAEVETFSARANLNNIVNNYQLESGGTSPPLPRPYDVDKIVRCQDYLLQENGFKTIFDGFDAFVNLFYSNVKHLGS